MTRKISAAATENPRVISSTLKVQVHPKWKPVADQEFNPKVFMTQNMHMQIS